MVKSPQFNSLYNKYKKILINLKQKIMKTPNFEDKQGKHPIPHAKGIAKDDNLNPKSQTDGKGLKKEKQEEE